MFGEEITLTMTEEGIIFAEIDGDWGKGATVEEAISYLRGSYVYGQPDYPAVVDPEAFSAKRVP